MRFVQINVNSKASIRDKAKLNICIAKDLTDSFGGRKADYLIKLNRRLKMKVALPPVRLENFYVKEIFEASGVGPIFPIADPVESGLNTYHEF